MTQGEETVTIDLKDYISGYPISDPYPTDNPELDISKTDDDIVTITPHMNLRCWIYRMSFSDKSEDKRSAGQMACRAHVRCSRAA